MKSEYCYGSDIQLGVKVQFFSLLSADHDAK